MDPAALLTTLPRLIEEAVAASPLLGYGAIFTAMLLENIFPPIPSELIMPLGGFYVQQGTLQLIPVVLAGSAGHGGRSPALVRSGPTGERAAA